MKLHPDYRLTVGSETFTNDKATQIVCTRPECNISRMSITCLDPKSRSYHDIFRPFREVSLEIQNTKNKYVKVFGGTVLPLKPQQTLNKGELLTAEAWGKGEAYMRTLCNTSYGVESANPTKDTVREIIQHLTDNYVEKALGGNATNWSITSTDTYVEDAHSGCKITSLPALYNTNFEMLSRLLDIVNAWAQTQSPAEPGIHYFVDPDGKLYLKEMDANHSAGGWPRYYRGSQTSATITQNKEILEYNFYMNPMDYANRVVLASAFRKPATDIWTEDGGAGFGNYGLDVCEYSVNQYIVGSHALHLSPDNDGGTTEALAYFPSTHDAGWDISKIGSPRNPPTLNFYVWCDDVSPFTYFNLCYTMLFTNLKTLGDATDDASYVLWRWVVHPEQEKWIHFSVPIGDYAAISDTHQLANAIDSHLEWRMPAGYDDTVDWGEVNGVLFGLCLLNTVNVYVDDLHFAGKIIREAYDSSEIDSVKKDRAVFLRLDTAVDDTLDSTTTGGDYSGTAARLATNELMRRTQVNVIPEKNRFLTATVKLPLKEDLLPGQLLHVRAERRANGSFRFDLDMRVLKISHRLNLDGYSTSVELTSDLYNTRTLGVPNLWGLLMKYAGALNHGEAKDLKASGLDIDAFRLSFDPTV